MKASTSPKSGSVWGTKAGLVARGAVFVTRSVELVL